MDITKILKIWFFFLFSPEKNNISFTYITYKSIEKKCSIEPVKTKK